MRAASRSALAMTAELARAIDNGELRLQYQPAVELATGRVTGVEALVRWEHPVRGLLPPAAFIDLAERSGLIVPLGRWVMEEACRQAAQWNRDALEWPLHVQVNVAARQLAEHSFTRMVAGALGSSGLDPGLLVVEVTESELVAELGPAVGRLAEVRALGARVSIDDFGTGFSSLSYLGRLPVDQVKIDKSFVDALSVGVVPAGPVVRAGAGDPVVIVTAIVELARRLGLETVAEGIEVEPQAKALDAMGCDHGQGYLFSRPVDPARIDELLALARHGTGHQGRAIFPSGAKAQQAQASRSPISLGSSG
ncbi:MAG: putative bifunctional diguanylate cyclase/phosphodiesterase [Acidimicrobiales bacterium]